MRQNNYYPFGLKHKGYNSGINGVDYNYKEYQGQEFTEDLGLNTHEWKYRMSDPAIGRFWQIDPLAEDYVYNGTYNFAENRVIDGNELEGLEWVDADGNLVYDPSIENDDGTRGGFTKYATDEDKKFGNGLKNSGEKGLEKFNQLVNSELPTTVNFSEEKSTFAFGETDPIEENGEVLGFKITVFKGSSEEAVNEPDDVLNSDEASIVKENNLSADDFTISVFGHEIDHATVKNVKLKRKENQTGKINPRFNSETIPNKTGKEILKNIANKKKKQ